MPLDAPLNRAFRSNAEFRALIRAVYTAPAHEMEQDWVEWKASEKLRAKPCHVEMARHIIGFANRDPGQAATYAEGTAYLLYGVAPGSIEGVGVIDIAQLEQGLERYLGADGPRWHATSVDYEGHTLVIVTVEAPKSGDPMYCLQAGYHDQTDKAKAKVYNAGTIYVRKQGKTAPADPASITILQQRYAQRALRLELGLEWADGIQPTITALDVSPPALEAWLNRERQRLLAPVLAAEQRRAYGAGTLRQPIQPAVFASQLITNQEYREPKAYRAEVEKYLAMAEEKLPELAREHAIEANAAHIAARIVNHTDRNFKEVQVEMHLPLGFYAEFYPEGSREVDFPRSPLLYGTHTLGQRTLDQTIGRVFRGPRPAPPGWVLVDKTCRVLFAAVHLRPQHMITLPSVRVLASPELAGQEMEVAWHATSKSADGLVNGTLKVVVDSTVMSASAVLSESSE